MGGTEDVGWVWEVTVDGLEWMNGRVGGLVDQWVCRASGGVN